MKNFFKKLSDEEVKFRIMVNLKISSIPILSSLILYSFLWCFLEFDLIFLESYSKKDILELRNIYYDFLFTIIGKHFLSVSIFYTVLMFIGVYISDMLIRPFRIISQYCERAYMKEKSQGYDPDFFSELRLLTGFCEYFFNVIENSIKNGKLSPVDIPKKYTGVHRPVFERSFFFQFSFLIIMTSLCVSLGSYILTVDLHTALITLSQSFVKQSPEIGVFMAKQRSILNGILYTVIASHILIYLVLALHLYYRVSIPAFGVFATFRSFIKGRYDSRVHLIGSFHLRPYGRKINKYLEFIQKNYT